MRSCRLPSSRRLSGASGMSGLLSSRRSIDRQAFCHSLALMYVQACSSSASAKYFDWRGIDWYMSIALSNCERS